MQSRVFIPLVDLAFLSLGAVIAILSQTRVVRTLPVEVTEIGRGIAVVSRDDLAVVTVTGEGLAVDGAPVDLVALPGAVGSRGALLRVDREQPTSALVQVMGVLAAANIELRIEVRERGTPAAPGGVSSW